MQTHLLSPSGSDLGGRDARSNQAEVALIWDARTFFLRSSDGRGRTDRGRVFLLSYRALCTALSVSALLCSALVVSRFKTEIRYGERPRSADGRTNERTNANGGGERARKRERACGRSE